MGWPQEGVAMERGQISEHRTELFSPVHLIFLPQNPLLKSTLVKIKFLFEMLSNFKEKVPLRTYIVFVTL